MTLDPRWLSCTVLELARTIYDEFGHLRRVRPYSPRLAGGNAATRSAWIAVAAPPASRGLCENADPRRRPDGRGLRQREIIKHCQGPGLHVRGCWVVDLLLGKE